MEDNPVRTQQILLTILADHLNGRNSTLPADYDEAELLSFARQHQCEGIVYHQTHIASLQRACALTTFYAVNRRDLLKQIHEVFTERNIPYLLFKGTEIARFYPEPMLRTMGDSDILVRKEDIEKASEALASIGFHGDLSYNNERHFQINGFQFELHHRLLYDNIVNLPHLKAWTDSVWEHIFAEDGVRYSMEPEFNLVYLLLHLRKHLLFQGVGLRQFMDVAVMAQQKLDWDKVNGYLDELDLNPFAANCFALCSRWFEMSFPINTGISDEFYKAATEKIFAGGVFGYADKDAKGNVFNFHLQKEGKLKVFLKHVFMPYSVMRNLQRFSFIDGRPYLLPAAWIYRVFLAVKERGTKSAVENMLVPLAISDEKISERENYLNQWGL